jgi:hypothetical protein
MDSQLQGFDALQRMWIERVPEEQRNRLKAYVLSQNRAIAQIWGSVSMLAGRVRVDEAKLLAALNETDFIRNRLFAEMEGEIAALSDREFVDTDINKQLISAVRASLQSDIEREDSLIHDVTTTVSDLSSTEQTALSTLRAEVSDLSDDESRWRTLVQQMQTQLNDLQTQVQDLRTQLRAEASLTQTILETEVRAVTFTINTPRVLVRRIIKWRHITVASTTSGFTTFFQPSVLVSASHVEDDIKAIERESLEENPDWAKIDHYDQIIKRIGGDASAWKKRRDDYVVDTIIDTRWYHGTERFFSVPDTSTFNDPDGNFGTYLGEQDNTMYLEDARFERPNLPDLEIGLTADNTAIDILVIVVNVLIPLAALITLPEAVAGIEVVGTELSTIWKKFVRVVSKNMLKPAVLGLLTAMRDPGKSVVTLVGNEKVEAEDGALLWAMSWDLKTNSPWQTEPVFVEDQNKTIWGSHFKVITTKTNSSPQGLGASITTATEFWMPNIETKVTAIDRDPNGNIMQGDVSFNAHIGVAESLGANVIKIGNVPFVGKDVGGIWKRYDRNNTVVTLSGAPI